MSAALVGCGSLSNTAPDRAWTELSSTHFVVQSDLRAEELESLGLEFERSYAALHSYLVPGGDDLPGQSRVIALSSVDEVRQIYSGPSSAYFRSQPALLGSSTEIVFSAQERGRALEVFRHELTHRFVAHYFPSAPRWVDEGLAQFLASAAIDGDDVVVGAPLSQYTFDGWQWHLWRIPFADVWPRMNELRERTGYLESPEYAGAWSLIHLLLLGDTRHRVAFGGYMSELREGQLDEPSAFAKHIDQAMLGELNAAYQAFPKRGNLPTETVKLRVTTPQFSMRSMPRAEAYALWGGLRDRNPLQHALALKDAEESIRSDPQKAAGYVLRGTLRLADRQGEAALADLRRARALEPNNRAVVRGLASLLLMTKGATPEVAELMEQLQKVARDSDDYHALARWELVQQRPERGLELALRATAVDPGCGNCFQTAAGAKAQQLDFAGAARYQRVVVNLSAEQENPNVLARLRLLEAARSSLAEPRSTSKGLAKPVVDAVLGASYVAFRACCERAFESKDDEAKHVMAVRIEVDAQGAVTAAESTSSTLPSATSAACVVEKLRAVRFPPPAGGATRLSFRLTFRR